MDVLTHKRRDTFLVPASDKIHLNENSKDGEDDQRRIRFKLHCKVVGEPDDYTIIINEFIVKYTRPFRCPISTLRSFTRGTYQPIIISPEQ